MTQAYRAKHIYCKIHQLEKTTAPLNPNILFHSYMQHAETRPSLPFPTGGFRTTRTTLRPEIGRPPGGGRPGVAPSGREFAASDGRGRVRRGGEAVIARRQGAMGQLPCRRRAGWNQPGSGLRAAPLLICRNIGARELMALVVSAARAYRERDADPARQTPRNDARENRGSGWSAYRMDRNGGGRHG